MKLTSTLHKVPLTLASVPLPCERTPASPVRADPAAAGFMPSSTPVQPTELSQPLDSLTLPAAVLGSLQQYLAARIPAAGMVGAVCAAADAAGRAFTSAHQLLAQAMQARQAASEVAEEEATACNAADSEAAVVLAVQKLQGNPRVADRLSILQISELLCVASCLNSPDEGTSAWRAPVPGLQAAASRVGAWSMVWFADSPG